MISLSGKSHCMAAVALLVLTLLAGYALLAWPWMAKYQFYQTHIEQLQDRLQRLNGIVASREALSAKLQQVRQEGSINAYYLNEPSPTLAATELQQKVKQIVETTGGSLVSTQILPVIDEDIFSRVAIQVRLTGDTPVLQKLIYALESKPPLLFLDNLQVMGRNIRRRSGPGGEIHTQLQLHIQFELAGYMRRT